MVSPIRVPSTGPTPADVLIVGEAPGADEELKLSPFVGASGQELTRMLHEAGILRSEARVTNVCPYRPQGNDISELVETSKKKAQDKGLSNFVGGKYVSDIIISSLQDLKAEISATSPKVIIALGETALWALTGESGITSWRGSILPLSPQMSEGLPSPPVVIPTYHPAAILRMWDWRAIAIRDLQRVAAFLKNPGDYQYPSYLFAVRPSLPGVMQTLNSLLSSLSSGRVRIACDIETISRHIACVGLAWSPLEAICIPFMGERGEPYWSFDEEVAIYTRLKEVLTHPNAFVVGQNFNYDAQHFAKHFGYLPNLQFDTMLAHHVLFPGLPKSLDFLSSLYCHFHRYWKDELKEYHKMPDDVHQFWTYNCKDCVITWEVARELEDLVNQQGMGEQFSFQMKMARHVLTTMLRGVRIDKARRDNVASDLLAAIDEREALIHQIVGFPLNTGSPKQMQEFFYGDLSIPPVLHRKTKKPTLDDDALSKISKSRPELAPLIDLISEKRSLGVFLSTFCLMPLDSDGRMRTSYNVAGTETFRFSSSENAFGSGGNLQNIPKGEEK